DVQHRPAHARAARVGRRRDSQPGGRRLPAGRTRHPAGARRPALDRAAGRPRRGRRYWCASDQDPDEFAVRGPRLAGVAAVLACGGECDHARRPARHPSRGRGRGAPRPSRHLRRHRFAVRGRGRVRRRRCRRVGRDAARHGRRRGGGGAGLAAALARDFGCTSHLELEFEKVYTRFLLPEVRGGATGSKKRYAGLVDDRLEIVGLEAVRRDWSGVARRFQRELLERVLHDQPVADFVRDFVAALRAGRLDGELVYRKTVRKPLDSYTRTTPAHVKAARKGGDSRGRVIAYVVTRAGPEPADALTAPPDREHYVTQQLKPLADAVLRFVEGPDFGDLSGLRKQLALF